MAIVIEEEKREINWFSIGIIILIISTVIIAAYYLFFAPVPFIEKIAPARLQSLQDLSMIKLEPEAIVSSPNFQILRRYVNPIEIGPVGKNNPFVK
jgi:uncharacterized membrane protein YukC